VGAGGGDSFETLLELAHVLGDAHAATASDAQIAKSGLEVFAARELREFERAGRVLAVCVERCLICLDEYAQEDECRLMGCRHTFHRECVDRWLSTGRNNCPACRGAVSPSFMSKWAWS
jgi:hypothetical protein